MTMEITRTPGSAPELELLFGDPHDDVPFGFAAIVADDDARRLNAHAEHILVEWLADAEFVPEALGGRWRDTTQLVTRLRPVFRRDPAVGFDCAVAALTAAAPVWVSGSDEQRADVARRLLNGKPLTVVVPGLEGGVDAIGSRLLLSHGSSAAVEDTPPRVLTMGMRGLDVRLAPSGDGEVDAVAAGAPLGSPLTRAIVPALAVGAVETALHETVRYARGRELYGGNVLDIPAARSLFADAVTDMLIADMLSATAVRALHVAPRESSLLSAVSGHLAPRLLAQAMRQTAVLVSSTFYARVEPYAIIEKLVRDIEALPVIAEGSSSCLLTVLDDLPNWAAVSQGTGRTDLRLFAATDAAPLAALDFGALASSSSSADPLAAALHADPLGAALRDPRIRAALAEDAPALVPLVAELARGLEKERALARALPADQLGETAAASSFDLAERISVHLAAGAVIGTWMDARGSEGVAADPLVALACLRRLTAALGGRRHPLETDIVDRIVAHAEACVAESRAMGVTSVAVFCAPANPS